MYPLFQNVKSLEKHAVVVLLHMIYSLRHWSPSYYPLTSFFCLVLNKLHNSNCCYFKPMRQESSEQDHSSETFSLATGMM